MAEKIIEKIEDIYPLTIVSMRFMDKFMIFKCECDSDFVFNAQIAEIHNLKHEKLKRRKTAFLFAMHNLTYILDSLRPA